MYDRENLSLNQSPHHYGIGKSPRGLIASHTSSPLPFPQSTGIKRQHYHLDCREAAGNPQLLMHLLLSRHDQGMD